MNIQEHENNREAQDLSFDEQSIKSSESQSHSQSSSFNSQSNPQSHQYSDQSQTQSTQSQIPVRLPPIDSSLRPIPIPSQEILPKDDYKNYKGRREFEYKDNGSLIINSHNLKLLCIKDGLYQYPEMNNKLYLHFKCIEKIENVQEYINIKSMYLQSNVIKKIEGLECLVNMQNLFLHNNMITEIQNLDHNLQLRVLNLSHNNIFCIKNLSHLRKLQTLTISNNYLKDLESLQHLGQCSEELTAIDLSNNQIEANAQLLNLIPQVKLLQLTGNPFCREVDYYRMIVVGTLKNVLYLDQRAVTSEDRVISQAFVKEGKQGVKKIQKQLDDRKKQLKTEKKQEIMKDINVHRQRKINVFRKSIQELEIEVEKLVKYREDRDNQDMWYYYDSSIQQKMKKIEEFNQHIRNITDRIQGKVQQIKQIKENNNIQQKKIEIEQEIKQKSQQCGKQMKLTEPIKQFVNNKNHSQQNIKPQQQNEQKEKLIQEQNNTPINSSPFHKKSAHPLIMTVKQPGSSENTQTFNYIPSNQSQSYSQSTTTNAEQSLDETKTEVSGSQKKSHSDSSEPEIKKKEESPKMRKQGHNIGWGNTITDSKTESKTIKNQFDYDQLD